MITEIQAKANKFLDLGMTQREAQDYSYARAALSTTDLKENCYEREVADTIQAHLGRPPRGGHSIFVPTNLRPRAEGLDTKTDSAGSFMVGTRVMSLVDAWLSALRVVGLGDSAVPGLQFNALFPTEDSGVSVNFVGENGSVDVPEVDPVFRAVLGTPHALQSTIAVSRQLLVQASNNNDLENRFKLNMGRNPVEVEESQGIFSGSLSINLQLRSLTASSRFRPRPPHAALRSSARKLARVARHSPTRPAQPVPSGAPSPPRPGPRQPLRPTAAQNQGCGIFP